MAKTSEHCYEEATKQMEKTNYDLVVPESSM